MGNKNSDTTKIPFSIAPWLSVRNSLQALAFYKKAFDASEVYRLDVPDGVIARLSIHGAEFWISDGTPDQIHADAEMLGGGSIRIFSLCQIRIIFLQR